jgi:hypothetical protein
MSLYLQFLAALITFDLLRAIVPAACNKLRAKIDSRRWKKSMERAGVNYKPSRETR